MEGGTVIVNQEGNGLARGVVSFADSRERRAGDPGAAG
jgi:hypothetical protein